MIKIIKDFIIYYKIRKSIYIHKDITKENKIHLQSISREEDKLINWICYDRLVELMLDDNISSEFVRWYRAWLIIREGLFRDYHITFDKPTWQTIWNK